MCAFEYYIRMYEQTHENELSPTALDIIHNVTYKYICLPLPLQYVKLWWCESKSTSTVPAEENTMRSLTRHSLGSGIYLSFLLGSAYLCDLAYLMRVGKVATLVNRRSNGSRISGIHKNTQYHLLSIVCSSCVVHIYTKYFEHTMFCFSSIDM